LIGGEKEDVGLLIRSLEVVEMEDKAKRYSYALTLTLTHVLIGAHISTHRISVLKYNIEKYSVALII
jgi:hypothetical protein